MISSFSRLAAGAALMAGCCASSIAGVIDTRPANAFNGYLQPSGADSAGETFTADDVNLASFTLAIDLLESGGVFRAIVMGTTAGVPAGAVLWQSADTAVPGSVTEFVFAPNLSITP